jgi:MFS family permease
VVKRPRRVYYGWVLVATLGVTETISWGTLYYAFSVILTPMEHDLGWSRATVTGAFSLALVLSGLTAAPVGRWLDGHGARGLMTLGSVAGVGLLVAWANVTDALSFYVIWAGLGIVMAATLYEPAFAVVAQWFDRQRTRALTAVTLMAGFASTIFLPLTSWLVDVQGWRAALVTLAALLALGTIPAHALLLRRRPEDMGLRADGDSADVSPGSATPRAPDVALGVALRDPSFYLLVVAFSLASIVAFGTAVHLVAILVDRGYDPLAAAGVAGLVGATQVLGRLILGPIGDRYPLRVVAAALLAIQPLAVLVLIFVPGTAGVLVFVALFGAAKGGMTIVRPSFVVSLYGRANYASIAGVLAVAVILAQALAPVVIGAAYDQLGSYTPILLSLVVVSALSCVVVIPVRQRVRKRVPA